jgi:hypothetical protein
VRAYCAVGTIVGSGSKNTDCLFNEWYTVIIRHRSLLSEENEKGMYDFQP